MNDPASTPRDSGNPVRDLPLPDLAGFTHRWVDAGGVRLHAVEGGQPDGPAIVLLAGFPQTWWAWRKVMPNLADRFQVIAIDLPGQGHSERPDISYDTHTAAAHVHAAVKALGVSTYWLVAHDIGAWVAFSLALTYQRQLHGLALLDAGIPGITLPDAIPTDPEQAWKTWHFAFHLVPDLPETLLIGREREYVGWFLKAKAFSSGTFDDAEIEQYAASVAMRRRSPCIPGLLPGRRRVGAEEPRSAGTTASDGPDSWDLQQPWLHPRHGSFHQAVGRPRHRDRRAGRRTLHPR